MSYTTREQEAASRILAAAEVLTADVPDALRRVSGGIQERSVRRLETLADLLERIFLEQVEQGLSARLAGYTSVAVLRKTADEDLEAAGLTRKAIRALRRRLARPTPGTTEGAFDDQEPPDLSAIAAELSEEADEGGQEG